MTAVAIVIIAGGLIALTVLGVFIALLYAQQQRSEERVLGLLNQLSFLGGRALLESPQVKQTSSPPPITPTREIAQIDPTPVEVSAGSTNAIELAPSAPVTRAAVPTDIAPPAALAKVAKPSPSIPPALSSTPARNTGNDHYRGEGLAPARRCLISSCARSTANDSAARL